MAKRDPEAADGHVDSEATANQASFDQALAIQTAFAKLCIRQRETERELASIKRELASLRRDFGLPLPKPPIEPVEPAKPKRYTKSRTPEAVLAALSRLNAQKQSAAPVERQKKHRLRSRVAEDVLAALSRIHAQQQSTAPTASPPK